MNGLNKFSTTTTTSAYKNATAGAYTAVFNTTGGQNYTSGTTTSSRTISKATTTVSLAATQGNFTYNGTAEKFTGSVTFPLSGVSGKLYINGLQKTSPYSNATAGAYTAVFNASGNINYSSATTSLSRTISKAAVSQSLTASGSYSPYDGTPPTITDTFNKTLVTSQSGITLDLQNNSANTGSSYSPTTAISSFNFPTLAGKYSAAGNYTYSSPAVSGVNYSFTASASLPVTIAKAATVVSLAWTRANFTYNGTTDNASASVTTPASGISGTLYINGVSESSPYKNAAAEMR